MNRGPETPGKRVALLVLGLALLLSAWVLATRPFTAPDEPSHYQRALSIVNGAILGPSVDYPNVRMNPLARAFIDHDTRAVLVPARLSPPYVVCMNGEPDLVGSCLEADPNGNFPPLPYLLPALALGISHSPSDAIWLMRVASALPSLAFLALAAALLWSGTGWSLLGLLAATTPMVLFSSSILNTSGVQITACLAFTAAVLRIARAPALAPGWVWTAFAVSGAVAMLAGPIGLAFAIADLALFLLLLGPRGSSELRRAGARRALVPGLTLLAAAVLALIYSHLAGFSTTVKITPLWRSLDQGLGQLPHVLRDVVGTFGAESVPLPRAADWLWWLLVVLLVAAGLWRGDRRERRQLIVVAVLALAFPVLFYAWAGRMTGSGLQGREVLPILALIPVVAGEIVWRHSSAVEQRRGPQLVLGGAIALIAGLQAYAWWFDARATSANGTWSPPLGWPVWALVAALGVAALVAFGAMEAAGNPQPAAAHA